LRIDDFSITLVQDSNEQLAYGSLFQSPYVVSHLETGDYSVLGLEHLISIERKSFSDLLGSLTNDRARFEREMRRARQFHRFFVVCECSLSDLLVDSFRPLSKASPHSVWGTICIWSTRYVPFLFTGNREASARLTEGILCGYAKQFAKGVEAMDRAARKLNKAS